MYGATDGTVTTFAVIVGAQGGGLGPRAALILGFANLASDGLSMGISSFMGEESEDQVKNRKKSRALSRAFVTFLAFIVVGSIPLLSYIYLFWRNTTSENTFLASVILSISAFIFIGMIKAWVVKRNIFRSIAESVALGGAAALVAYAVAILIETIVS